mmetsp:Transcript_49490/g.119070  ORF Transcript_49490/g.119070 Transcript_49490/m.119070 type:complete len:290 (-) Transcript_49490:47-916(-)
MPQHCLSPLSNLQLDFAPCQEVRIDSLQPQSGLTSNCPEQSEVGTACRMIRPRWVFNEDDLVPSVAQQRQQALGLIVKAMAWPANLCCPEEIQLLGFRPAFMDADLVSAVTLKIQGARNPDILLCVCEAFQLSLTYRIGVAPLLEATLKHGTGKLQSLLGNCCSRELITVERRDLLAFNECSERHRELLAQRQLQGVQAQLPALLLDSKLLRGQRQQVLDPLALAMASVRPLLHKRQYSSPRSRLPGTRLLEGRMPDAPVLQPRLGMIPPNAKLLVIDTLSAHLLGQQG